MSSGARTADALVAIYDERRRQDRTHPYDVSDEVMLAVLVEEVGEVAKAMLEGEGLTEELTQVAAVALKWLEQRL